MAGQATPPGASTTSASAIAAQAQAAADAATADMGKATQMAEALFNKAAQASGAQADAYIKMSGMLDKIAKQQAELVKINTELQDLEAKRVKIQKEMDGLQGDALEDKKKELAQLREEVTLKKNASIEAKKAAQEQSALIEKMSKQQGALGKMFDLGKNSMVQYIAGVATLASALTNMAKVTQDVLDISALSGNYEALQGGFVGLTKAAYSFQKGMGEARVGLRYLGYSSDEVNSSFKELSVTASRIGGKLDTQGVADLTTVTGRLARLLGVTLPEATQYMVTMQQKFGASTATTAAALLDIYDATVKYNTEAGRTVIVGRDLTKVMMDLSRESKGVVVDQRFLETMLTSNLLKLQAEGRNYQESLDQASMFVKKMTAEAPDWAKILAGRELRNQLRSAADVTPAMAEQLDQAAPGLSKRIKEILTKPVDEFTKQKLLQEALSGTQIGVEAMYKGIGNIVDRLGSKANIALQAIYHISATEADAGILQLKQARELAAQKKRIQDGDEAGRRKELEGLGVTEKAYQDILMKKENGADLDALIQKKHQEDAAASIKANDAEIQKKKEAQVLDLTSKREAAKSAGNTQLAQHYDDQLNKLDEKKSLAKTEEKTGNALAAVQGEKGGLRENLSEFWERFLKDPLIQSAASLALLVTKAGLEVPGMVLGTLSKVGGTLASLDAAITPIVAGGGALGASVGAATLVGGVAAAAGTGVAVGTGINYADEQVGKLMGKKEGYMAGAIQGGFNKLSGLVGGRTYKTDAELETRTNEKAIADRLASMQAFWHPGMVPTNSAPLLQNVPASGLPTPMGGTAPIPAGSTVPQGAGGSGAQGGPGGISSMQNGRMVSSATGTDYEITTTHTIPMAQIFAQNMNIHAKGVKGPTG